MSSPKMVSTGVTHFTNGKPTRLKALLGGSKDWSQSVDSLIKSELITSADLLLLGVFLEVLVETPRMVLGFRLRELNYLMRYGLTLAMNSPFLPQSQAKTELQPSLDP